MESGDRRRTGGKINLFLRIKGKRPDGYHELETLFLPVPLPWDELIFRPGSFPGVRLLCGEPGIDPERNTVTGAYELYASASGFRPPLEVELIKGIPHGAGLGGGSADAALALNWLQEHAPRPLENEALRRLAAAVGADVPFFLSPEASLGEGAGETLRPCSPPLDGVACVLLCPDIRVGTAWAFARWDAEREERESLTEPDAPDKNSSPDFRGILRVENDLEPVVFAAHPVLARFKARLFREGAAAAGMSGSGSALFGLFREPEAALAAARRLREDGRKARCAVHGPFFLENRPSAGRFAGVSPSW